MATVKEKTAGRVTPRDLKTVLALASAAKAKHVVLSGDCLLSFRTDRLQARLPFAAREWDGESRVDRQALARAVRACRGDILVESTDEGLSVTSGALRVALPLINGELIESHPEGTRLMKIEARLLARALLRAEPFASADETRPVLNAVALDMEHGNAVSTDSYRLTSIDVPELKRRGGRVLMVPRDAVKPLAMALATHAGDAVLYRVEGEPERLVVLIGDQRWTITLIAGKFPAWRELLPDQDGSDRVEVDGTELASVASLIADAYSISRARHAPLVLGVTLDGLTVSTRHPEGVQVTQQLEAKVEIKEPSEIGLNPSFLHDVATAIAPDPVRLTVTGPLRPLLATAPDAVYLLMPIRLNV